MGVSADTVNPDLNAILAGGDEFFKRISELNQVKANADASVAALKASNDIVGTIAEANKRIEQATNTLNDAKSAAASIIAKATKEADDILGAAKRDTAAMVDQATKSAATARKGAEDWIAQATAEAKSTLDDAKKAKADVAATLAANKEAQKAINDTQVKLDAALADANALKSDLTTRAANLQAAVSAALR